MRFAPHPESQNKRALANLTGYVHGMIGHIPQAHGEPLEHFVGMLVLPRPPRGSRWTPIVSGYYHRATMVPVLEGVGDELGREMASIFARIRAPASSISSATRPARGSTCVR